MNTTTRTSNRSVFREEILNSLSSGIKNEERFENISLDIINGISHQLLLIDGYNQRKNAVDAFMKQLQEAELIRRYHMVYETPGHNKQLNAALAFLKEQFKLRFSKYFS